MTSINRNGWLYKIAKFGNSNLKYGSETDSCELRTAIFLAILLALFLGSMAGIFFMLMILTPLASLYLLVSSYIHLGYFKLSPEIRTGLTILGVELAFAIIMGGFWWRSKRVKKNKSKEPGALTVMYRGWKDKHCTKIDIEG